MMPSVADGELVWYTILHIMFGSLLPTPVPVDRNFPVSKLALKLLK